MLSIYRRISLWLLLACTLVIAQPKHDLPMIPALKLGREAFFAFRITQATQQFQQVIQYNKDPMSQAMAQYHLSSMAVWQFGFGQTTARLNEFKTHNTALNTALRYVSDPLWRRFLTAESAMHRAIVGILRNDMLGAAMAGREAYNNYVWCIEQDPYFEEAYKGMGLMQVLIGSAPRTYQGLLGFLGYRGTVQDGLNHLERAITKAKWVQEEAAIYFALSDEILNRNERNGIQKIGALQKAYPQSPLLNFLYGYALRNKFQAREALPYLEAATRSGKKSEVVVPTIFLFYLGELYFRLNQYEEAIRELTRFTQEFQGTTLVGQAYFKMGQALEMGGDRKAAVEMYQKVKAGFAYDMDEFALRQATLRIETPMTPIEKQLLRLQNASDAGDYAFVLTEVENIL
ncbi:MAG TPA: tetratricopeptide repeat protein, partial [Rhodothermales bacterium]|nr:tetratricopeptide repeat protein [Rhodothermales bacterium]